ncbi:unnamed protein product [Plutella xylostella]|uniref:(diamondback moth) hypothetical protein n=1 Tax=Plutella xylostella TaxID=51655 RepID=A0A8S4DXE8_PLUXY|nr:unnamed protein product [Plutella xylostella]
MRCSWRGRTSTSPTYLSRVFTYSDPGGDISWGEGVFFSFGVVFCSAVNVAVQHPFMMAVMHVGMKMRVGLCSLIYRKALKVSSQAMTESSAGLVVNLMANDVNRFDTGPLFLHYLWIGPVETVLMTAFLYRQLGMPAIYGSIVVFAVIPFQIFLGTRTAAYRRQTAERSDERVRLMKEIVMGMEVIKMYTWEHPFRQIIDTVRREEIYAIKRTSYIRGITMSFIMFTSRFGIFITLLLYVTFIDRISVESVFFLTCYYNIMKQTMTLYFPQAIGQVAEMNVAVQRIREYLLSEECKLTIHNIDEDASKINIKDEPGASKIVKNPVAMKEFAIEFENASSRWIRQEKDDVKDINLQIPTSNLTTIIGAVGSGKSTLLHMILGELPCTSGSLKTEGTISYAGQEPWLFIGSVRQNILFGQPFVKQRYMDVCRVCALERDISLFPHGDKTIVGERGVSLSGGQRARVNLARAVYKEADIYLLDDPLSAVDTQVAKHIFERCIKRYLIGKTVVLVTHQLQFIKSVDKIVIMRQGKILTDGNYNDVMAQDLDIIRLMEDNTREVKEEDEATQIKNAASVIETSAASLHRYRLSTMLNASSMADQRQVAEAQTAGRVSGSVYTNYFYAGAACPCVALVLITFVLAQCCASAGDFWLSKWSYVEDQLTGDNTMDDLLWAEQGLQRSHYTLIFGVITLATILIALIRSFMFFSLCMRSSIKLHDKMFDCISHSPMSFFHANSSGRILNRFSKDMGAVDELLPQAMMDCFQIILNLIGVLIVILLVDLTLIIPITAALIIFYILRVIYIRTTGAVKRLEGITRSPVFSHLNATVLGVATIRSFGTEQLLTQEFDRHQDLHSAAWYLFITSSRAFGYFLDVICLLFIICVTFSCLMKSDAESSKVGLAITQSISLTGVFQWGMRQSAEMENQMTSVERVLEYTKLPQEDILRASGDKKPPSGWPSQGHIVFSEVTLKYARDGDPVLHKLDFEILSQAKIGIVGRTGAGKSSIIQALFRLAYLEGSIFIDGIDTSSVGLHDLREKVSIIPQEPVLFSGTMRKNLDPFDEYSDEVLIRALEDVELKNEDEGFGALYKQVSEGGTNFSVGERQLVCLARAIVRKNPILVLDEATANVDAQTDALIQTAIRVHFRSCTVLTIAHRLNTVIDSDKILVLDAGRLMEYDHPHILLRVRGGYFRKMVAETGPVMTSHLRRMAALSYNSKKD